MRLRGPAVSGRARYGKRGGCAPIVSGDGTLCGLTDSLLGGAGLWLREPIESRRMLQGDSFHPHHRILHSPDPVCTCRSDGGQLGLALALPLSALGRWMEKTKLFPPAKKGVNVPLLLKNSFPSYPLRVAMTTPASAVNHAALLHFLHLQGAYIRVLSDIFLRASLLPSAS